MANNIKKSLLEKIQANDRTYLTGETGALCDVPMRTVSYWCEREIIIANTTGTGDRRRFTPLQVVEIALVKDLSEAGMSITRIKSLMTELRGYPDKKDLAFSNLTKLENFLRVNHAWLAVPLVGKNALRSDDEGLYIPIGINDLSKWSVDSKHMLIEDLLRKENRRVLIFNVTEVAGEVIDRM